MQPLGNADDKQVDDLELRQIATDKRLLRRPQPLSNLARRRAAQQAAAPGAANAASMSRVESLRAYISTARSSASLRPIAKPDLVGSPGLRGRAQPFFQQA
jgi:hypothetical protein